jgi:hypothetical protein
MFQKLGIMPPITNLETLYATPKYALGSCIIHMR